jgi:valyl-tRNA synthetase
VLDPDRKKMSKSKGNVLTPMHLLDEYGADAVRYWSLSAKLGVDTAFDEKVLKVGRRLSTKLFNVSKYVLSQSGPERPITRELDLGFLVRLRETVERASASLDEFEYSGALDQVERFFWNGFTDTYVELVKNRARSEDDPDGRGSAVAALQLGLKVFLRLFAPFLPYITEEAWSWGFARTGREPSVHRAAWPSAADFTGLRAPEAGGATFDAAVGFLEAVHRAKSQAGASVGRHLARLRVAASPATLRLFEGAKADAAAAARVERLDLGSRDGLDDGAFEVLECELAAGRPEA